MNADYFERFPAVGDLRRRAQRRIPRFSWAHLDSGTGEETTLRLNRDMLNAVRLTPRCSQEEFTPDLTTQLLGQTFDAPFGIAPLGATGLIWPGGERFLAESARQHGIPYCLSTAACETLETIGPIARDRGWFQLYPARDRAGRDDLIRRAKDGGFTTLILTVDVPEYGMRERQRRAGFTESSKVGLRALAQVLSRPGWALATLKYGSPSFRLLEEYTRGSVSEAAKFVVRELNAAVDDDYFKQIRAQWQGPLLVKGIVHPDEARRFRALGADGIVVSNHGGRQFDAAPASIQALPKIVEAVGGEMAVVFDSGVRSGLDIVRALALGADFVLLGRAFAFGVAALGSSGPDHVCRLLKEDLSINMRQLGVATINDLKAC